MDLTNFQSPFYQACSAAFITILFVIMVINSKKIAAEKKRKSTPNEEPKDLCSKCKGEL